MKIKKDDEVLVIAGKDKGKKGKGKRLGEGLTSRPAWCSRKRSYSV